jgi:mRNA interferase RelE/StbE
LPWIVRIARTAEKQIERLDRQAQRRIVDFLRERVAGAADPRLTGKPLRGDRAGLWRYRVGDYRLICRIEDQELVVMVLQVGHRKEIYQ